jgi:catechol-2,3-dioxygenase
MKINELHLLTRDLPAQARFYSELLGLPVQDVPARSRIDVQVGQTRLIFKQAEEGWQGKYHFAINIPPNQFVAAKTWLESHSTLLTDRHGAEEFYFENWNALSVYFNDAAGNVLELIARRDLPSPAERPFDQGSLLCVSEVGLASEDALATVQMLGTGLGVSVYRGPENENFTALGDENGLLIVVRRGRIWYPDTGIPAELLPVRLVVENAQGKNYHISGFPYQVEEMT